MGRRLGLNQARKLVQSAADLVLEVYANVTLTGGSFVDISGVSPSETGLQVNTTATAVDVDVEGAVRIAMKFVKGGERNTSDFRSTTIPSVDIPLPPPPSSAYGSVTLCARAMSGTDNVVTALFTVTEEW